MDYQQQQEQDEQRPAIYSKATILGFSVFFSPVVGSILLMINLRQAGKKAAGFLVLLFGVVYMLVVEFALISLSGLRMTEATSQKLIANHQIVYYSLALNVLGGAILAEYFFKKYFPETDYRRKSIVWPLLVVLMVTMALSALV